MRGNCIVEILRHARYKILSNPAPSLEEKVSQFLYPYFTIYDSLCFIALVYFLFSFVRVGELSLLLIPLKATPVLYFVINKNT